MPLTERLNLYAARNFVFVTTRILVRIPAHARLISRRRAAAAT